MAAFVLIVAGCGGSGDTSCDEPLDRSALRGEELPVDIEQQRPPEDGRWPATFDEEEIEAAIPGRSEDHRSITDQVMHELQRETLVMAGAIGQVRPGRCEGGRIDQSVGATTRCTVVYEGVEVHWNVEIAGSDQGVWTQVDYFTQPLASVQTARGVYDAFGRYADPQYHPDARCDEIPAAFRAELGEDTGYRCQMISSSCTDGDRSFEWTNVAVRVDEEGGVTFGPPD